MRGELHFGFSSCFKCCQGRKGFLELGLPFCDHVRTNVNLLKMTVRNWKESRFLMTLLSCQINKGAVFFQTSLLIENHCSMIWPSINLFLLLYSFLFFRSAKKLFAILASVKFPPPLFFGNQVYLLICLI